MDIFQSPSWKKQYFLPLLVLICSILVWMMMPFGLFAAPRFQPTPPNSVSFPGNYSSQIGGADWSPIDPHVQATAASDTLWTLTIVLPGGSYEFKATVNGSWDENYGLGGEAGGDNVEFIVPADGGIVTFSFDGVTHAVNAEVTALEEEADIEPVLGDGIIARNTLHHDSRLDLYRIPFGAVPEQSDVTLRFRTSAGDVEAVHLLLGNESTGSRLNVPMVLVAEKTATLDGESASAGYAWWESTVNVGAAPTIHTYSFEIVDGNTVVYYIDDDGKGGEGDVGSALPMGGTGSSGWDIYTYVPNFQAPDWARNAVIYQIFPDRFRNGSNQNDPGADDWFYPEERGHAFPIQPWNTIVPDPQPNDPGANPEWYATWSSTFYGGDLQGVIDRLGYLQDLGITTIYFNPVFESPSNHRYDGRTFDFVDDALGIKGDPEASLAVLKQLGMAVEERGMNLILDGVPNHLSTDAYIFDRYSRHELTGACEAEDSIFRNWFFFSPARPEGSGNCAGDTTYEKWAGVSTLPQLNNNNEDVIANWLGPNGVALRWLRVPGVAGWRIDVVPDVANLNPQFFERLRAVVKDHYPEAMLYSETWQEPDVRGRVLGDEFDSTMNYRFRSAVLGFLRDVDWEDGDGVIKALNATEFDSALRAIQEDYPPAVWQSAMNLIGSHDVNRAVRVLDHDGIDYGILAPLNGFEDGRNRLRLASALQFTLPGAPTIYYGDEVGLVGFGSDIPRDDPYNRQPYPWADEAGYDKLPLWRQADADLLAHYQFLGQLRAQYSFLRTGEWTTFRADDGSRLYVYGRSDESGAAVIAINSGNKAAIVDLDLTGFVPRANSLLNAVTGDQVETPLSVEVGPMDFAIWITPAETDLSRPETPSIRSALAGEATTSLEIEVVDETATLITVWRSIVDGGYEPVKQLEVSAPATVVFSDADLRLGVSIYYRVSAVKANGMESELSAPVRLTPGYEVDGAALIAPLTVEHVISAITPTVPLQGRILIEDVTGHEGRADGVVAQLGLLKVDPNSIPSFTDVVWTAGEYVGEAGGADVYSAGVIPNQTGDYIYGWRFSTTRGADWIYVDASGIVEELPWSEPGRLTVLPSDDNKAPNRPFRIDEIFASPNQIVIAWRVSRTADLHHYVICRRDVTVTEDEPCAGRDVVLRGTQVYTDTVVVVDHVYEYTVQAVDTSFNLSAASDTLTVTATENFVDVTFRVRVPDFTPAEDSVVIAGNDRDVFGGGWSPVQPMTKVGENVWEYTTTVKEGTPLQYKYTRGSWETVEQWGTISGLANRPAAVIGSVDGTQVIDNTAMDWDDDNDSNKAVRNWRDPLVVSLGIDTDAVTVTFNSAIVPTVSLDDVVTVVAVDGSLIPGSVLQTSETTIVFVPVQPLPAADYRVTVFNVATDVAMMSPHEVEIVIE